MEQDILSLVEIRQLLKDRNLKAMAFILGMSYMTLWRIATGNETNPRYETVRKISDYLLNPRKVVA